MNNIKLHQSLHKQCSALLLVMEIADDAEFKNLCAEKYAKLMHELTASIIDKTLVSEDWEDDWEDDFNKTVGDAFVHFTESDLGIKDVWPESNAKPFNLVDHVNECMSGMMVEGFTLQEPLYNDDAPVNVLIAEGFFKDVN